MMENNKPFWFLDALGYIRIAVQDGADGLSAIEFGAPQRSSPPLD